VNSNGYGIPLSYTKKPPSIRADAGARPKHASDGGGGSIFSRIAADRLKLGKPVDNSQLRAVIPAKSPPLHRMEWKAAWQNEASRLGPK
jgi:hypothetical protein